MIIHRMVEFVVREGPLFEAMIMNKEIDNEMYRFLFENQSPEHTYYRWKLYSVLFSDSPQRWRTDQFRMFKGGSVWKPPPMNPYMMDRSMIEQLKKPEPESRRNKHLSDSQRVRFEFLLRHITSEREAIGEAMVWCLDHADSAEEITTCIAESLSSAETQLTAKISRLYLVSDILHNCTAKVSNASKYRKCFQEKLPQIFEGVHQTYDQIASRLRAEAFKQRVMRVFRAWEDWAIYPQDFLIKQQNTVLGFNKQAEGDGGDDSDDVDGAPLSDSDDVDGVPLDGAALLKKARRQHAADEEEDVDGVPLDDLDGTPLDGGRCRGVGDAQSEQHAHHNARHRRGVGGAASEAARGRGQGHGLPGRPRVGSAGCQVGLHAVRAGLPLPRQADAQGGEAAEREKAPPGAESVQLRGGEEVELLLQSQTLALSQTRQSAPPLALADAAAAPAALPVAGVPEVALQVTAGLPQVTLQVKVTLAQPQTTQEGQALSQGEEGWAVNTE